MSTICQICFCSSEEIAKAAIESYFIQKNREFEITTTEWPIANEHGSFVRESEPTMYSLKELSEGLVAIYFNSFSLLNDLATFLSLTLDCAVVVNHYQSTATATYWGYHLKGQLLREIHSGDAVVYKQAGIPLDFENEPLGHNIADVDEENMIIFDEKDIDYYNSSVEIPLKIYQNYPVNWINFELVDNKGVLSEVVSTNKPWWKFW